MSMIISLRRVSEIELQQLLESPKGIVEFLYPEIDETPDSQVGAEKVAHHEMDLDKAWHAIHFLLTDSAWGGESPGSFLLHGGSTIGKVDVGYGPARAAFPNEVRAIADFLAETTIETLRRRFDPAKLAAAEIYPEIWEEEGDESFEYIEHFFSQLSEFVTETARNAMGLVIWMC